MTTATSVSNVSPAAAHTPELQRLTRDFSSVSATALANGMQKVSNDVMAKGTIVITRHDKPAMVLLSVERYLKLEQAAEPHLDALTRQFDEMLARMQGAEAAQAMDDAFAMSPQELGKAAVRAARPSKAVKAPKIPATR